MSLYLVDRDLPGVTVDQFAAAQRAANAISERFTAAGTPVRYIRSTFLPTAARFLCLFEAASADLVAAVNQARRSHLPACQRLSSWTHEHERAATPSGGALPWDVARSAEAFGR